MSYDRDAVPAHMPGLRLLPWESEGGKPCFLSADGAGSMLSRLADEIEAEQLCDGAEVLKGAVAVLDDGKAGNTRCGWRCGRPRRPSAMCCASPTAGARGCPWRRTVTKRPTTGSCRQSPT